MGMLSVCYAKVKTVLNICKVEMLSLGYGNVKVRLRQNCSLTYASAQTAIRVLARVCTHMGAGKLGAGKLNKNNEALLNLC